MDSILAVPIPVQAAPVQKGPKSLAIPALPAKQSTEPPLPLTKQPLFNYLATPFYQSVPWSLPRETCCSPPRPGPRLRMYTQADLSTLFGEWFGVNAKQSLGSLATKVCCSIPFPEPRHLPSGSEPPQDPDVWCPAVWPVSSHTTAALMDRVGMETSAGQDGGQFA